MNALCNGLPQVNYLLMNNKNFCQFIEIEDDTRALLINQYVASEKGIIRKLSHNGGGSGSRHNSCNLSSS